MAGKLSVGQLAGLKPFLVAIWNPRGLPMPPAEHKHRAATAIDDIGYERAAERNRIEDSEQDERNLKDRWRYDFEGTRYYHDCDEETPREARGQLR